MRKDPPSLRSLQQRMARLCGGVLLTLLMALGAASHAAEHRNGLGGMKAPPVGNGFAPAPGISIEQATAIARKHTGGRVLSATPKQRSSGMEYRIRMLVDGERVMTVVVDHQGRIKNKR